MSAALSMTAAVAGQSPVDFAHDVWPIIESRCLKCHASQHTDAGGRLRKPKGGLVLDNKAGILRGSDDGVVLVAGDADASPLYTRTVLPEDDDDIMPAQGKPLTREQTETLQRWIAAGADFGAWTGVAAATAVAAPAARVAERVRLLEELAQGVVPLADAALAKARGAHARIEAVQPGSPLLRVEFPGDAQITDADVVALQAIGGHVAHLDLAGTGISDRALAAVASMPRLVQLDLHETRVGDAGVAALAKLGELRSLNLFGTDVTDKGLASVARLAKLRAVYLWRSKVTEAGVQRLREQAAELVVHHEPELPTPEPPGDAPRRRRR